MRFSVSILEYLGKIKDGILVLISIIYDNKYYEATFYYDRKDILLTISKELEDVLGHKIIEDIDYTNVLKDILSKISPYNEIVKKVKIIY